MLQMIAQMNVGKAANVGSSDDLTVFFAKVTIRVRLISKGSRSSERDVLLGLQAPSHLDAGVLLMKSGFARTSSIIFLALQAMAAVKSHDRSSHWLDKSCSKERLK